MGKLRLQSHKYYSIKMSLVGICFWGLKWDSASSGYIPIAGFLKSVMNTRVPWKWENSLSTELLLILPHVAWQMRFIIILYLATPSTIYKLYRVEWEDGYEWWLGKHLEIIGNLWNTRVKTAYLGVHNRAGGLQKVKQECQPVDHDVQFDGVS
jgi:hypothetical protein